MGPRRAGDPPQYSSTPPRPPDPGNLMMKLQVELEETAAGFHELHKSMASMATEQAIFQSEILNELRQLRLERTAQLRPPPPPPQATADPYHYRQQQPPQYSPTSLPPFPIPNLQHTQLQLQSFTSQPQQPLNQHHMDRFVTPLLLAQFTASPPPLLDDAVSAQPNNNLASFCWVSDTSTRVSSNQFNFLNDDCNGMGFVFGANGIDEKLENGESVEKRAEVNSGDGREFSEPESVIATQDEGEDKEQLSNGMSEFHALQLFDKMPKLDGLCNARRNIAAIMSIRDKDGRTDKSNVLLGDSNGLHPIRYEMVTYASEVIKTTSATDNVIKSCLKYVDEDAEARRIIAANLDRNMNNKVVSEPVENGSKLEGSNAKNSEYVRDDEVDSLENEHGDGFDDKENNVKQPVFDENLSVFQSSYLSGGTVGSSDMHELEASLELDVGSSKPSLVSKDLDSKEATKPVGKHNNIFIMGCTRPPDNFKVDDHRCDSHLIVIEPLITFYLGYIDKQRSLRRELANEEKPVESQKLGSLILENSLDAKEQHRKSDLVQRWLALDPSAKHQIKMCLLQSLSFLISDACSTTSQVFAKVAPQKQQWSGMIGSLWYDNHQLLLHVKQATLETLGYLCEEVSPKVVDQGMNALEEGNSGASNLFKDNLLEDYAVNNSMYVQVHIDLPTLSDKDRQVISSGRLQNKIDFLSPLYTRLAEDVSQAREYISKLGDLSQYHIDPGDIKAIISSAIIQLHLNEATELYKGMDNLLRAFGIYIVFNYSAYHLCSSGPQVLNEQFVDIVFFVNFYDGIGDLWLPAHDERSICQGTKRISRRSLTLLTLHHCNNKMAQKFIYLQIILKKVILAELQHAKKAFDEKWVAEIAKEDVMDMTNARLYTTTYTEVFTRIYKTLQLSEYEIRNSDDLFNDELARHFPHIKSASTPLRYFSCSAISVVAILLLYVALVMCVTALGGMITIETSHIEEVVEEAKKKQLDVVFGLYEEKLFLTILLQYGISKVGGELIYDIFCLQFLLDLVSKMLQTWTWENTEPLQTQMIVNSFLCSYMVIIRVDDALELSSWDKDLVKENSTYELAPKYFGPFQVITRIEKVPYMLELPPTTKIYPVFHVFRLKKKVGSIVITSPDLPPMFESDKTKWYPAKIIDTGIFKKNNSAVTKWLVQWKNTNEEDATWEDPEEFMNRFPEFQT